jgi:hypothetical protein
VKTTVLSDVIPYSLVKIYDRSEKHTTSTTSSPTTEEVWPFVTPHYLYQTAGHHIQEGGNLHHRFVFLSSIRHTFRSAQF